MSIWGKVLGGAAGFALGGPLGAIIGTAAGHAIDRMRQPGGSEEATKSIAFTIAVIVLGAKMAKADGVVTRDEVEAFHEVFHVPEDEIHNVDRVFDQARRDSRGFEPYARQIASMFRENPSVLEELLFCLAHVAKADGIMHPAEIEYLRAVSQIFALDDAAFERVTEIELGADKADAYTVLGVPRETSDDKLKAAYRALVRENHPDRLIAQGMPQEFVDVANEKLAAINVAYDRICDERGLS
jgi:DnaJ like chaperone protein